MSTIVPMTEHPQERRRGRKKRKARVAHAEAPIRAAELHQRSRSITVEELDSLPIGAVITGHNEHGFRYVATYAGEGHWVCQHSLRTTSQLPGLLGLVAWVIGRP